MHPIGPTPEHRQEKRLTVMDEIKRELEIVLSETRSHEVKDAEPVYTIPERKAVSIDKPADPIKVIQAKPLKEPTVVEHKPYAQLGPSIADSAIGDANVYDDAMLVPVIDATSYEEARKGIVWSEIIGKPIALRE
jgi:hypothetical protein